MRTNGRSDAISFVENKIENKQVYRDDWSGSVEGIEGAFGTLLSSLAALADYHASTTRDVSIVCPKENQIMLAYKCNVSDGDPCRGNLDGPEFFYKLVWSDELSKLMNVQIRVRCIYTAMQSVKSTCTVAPRKACYEYTGRQITTDESQAAKYDFMVDLDRIQER
jgi:hypothetical protein